MIRFLLSLLLFASALALPTGEAEAKKVAVKGFAQNVDLDGKVLRLTFERGGERFFLVYATSDGAYREQELVSRPGERLYDVRHLQPMWRGRASGMGIYGADFTKAEVVEPDLLDELSLLFSYFPVEQINSNTLRGYSFFGVFLQTILVWIVLIGSASYAVYRQDWRTLPAALLGGLAMVWIVGEAVVFNDHWEHVVFRDKNVNAQDWRAFETQISGYSNAIGEGDWGHRGVSHGYKNWLEYRLADKPLRPPGTTPPPKVMITQHRAPPPPAGGGS